MIKTANYVKIKMVGEKSYMNFYSALFFMQKNIFIQTFLALKFIKEQELKIVLQKADSEFLIEKVKSLYYRAFPISEQKPFELLLKCAEKGTVDILCAIGDDGDFLCEAIAAVGKTAVLLDFLAVEENKRGGGVGSAALEALFSYYANKRLVLEIESTYDKSAENYSQRTKRKLFYLKNGMVKENYMVNLAGVEMEILSHGGGVSFEEYNKILSDVYSKQVAQTARLIEP